MGVSTIRHRTQALLVAVLLGAAPLALGCATAGGGATPAPSPGAEARKSPPLRSGRAPLDSGKVVDADRARTHYRLGSDHLRKGRPALALRELRQAEEYDPTDPWIHLALAEAYIHRGHLADAEAHARRALELRPGFQEALLHLSALYIHLERYAEAAELAQQLAEDPTYPQPWKALTNLGFSQLQMGRIGEARRNLELAIEYYPGYWQAVLNLGILEQKEERKLQALQRFERVLELQPGASPESEVHYRMAVVYISLGNRERALEHLTASRRASGPWAKLSEEYLKRLR